MAPPSLWSESPQARGPASLADTLLLVRAVLPEELNRRLRLGSTALAGRAIAAIGDGNDVRPRVPPRPCGSFGQSAVDRSSGCIVRRGARSAAPRGARIPLLSPGSCPRCGGTALRVRRPSISCRSSMAWLAQRTLMKVGTSQFPHPNYVFQSRVMSPRDVIWRLVQTLPNVPAPGIFYQCVAERGSSDQGDRSGRRLVREADRAARGRAHSRRPVAACSETLGRRVPGSEQADCAASVSGFRRRQRTFRTPDRLERRRIGRRYGGVFVPCLGHGQPCSRARYCRGACVARAWPGAAPTGVRRRRLGEALDTMAHERWCLPWATAALGRAIRSERIHGRGAVSELQCGIHRVKIVPPLPGSADLAAVTVRRRWVVLRVFSVRCRDRGR